MGLTDSMLVLVCVLAAARGEGLYKEGSAVISLTKKEEVPFGAGAEQPFMLVEVSAANGGCCTFHALTVPSHYAHSFILRGAGTASTLHPRMRISQGRHVHKSRSLRWRL